jgi:hypothetical protein
MKRLTMSIFIIGLAVWFSFASTPSSKAEGPRKERAIIGFEQTVKLKGVLLRGEYVIVHDEERMARGEPCTWIYRSDKGKEGALVISFHCEHVERAKADHFVIRLKTNHTPYVTPEIEELQFADSTAGHRVPGV